MLLLATQRPDKASLPTGISANVPQRFAHEPEHRAFWLAVRFDHAYRREIELADAIIAATSLDSPPAWWPEDLFGSWRLDDLREILLHVIVETACDAGHLDAARELIDGRQSIVLTE